MAGDEKKGPVADQLPALRKQIDAIDKQLLALIGDRARCAQAVAEVKIASGDDSTFYRPEREAQVLRKVMEANAGPLDDEEVARLFREIMSACLALEQPVTVAYLGPEGTFTQAAALKHFGHSAVCRSMTAIDEVFREVSSGAVNYGVVPVENSTEGVVNHTLDSFLDSSLKICGEVELRIHHHFMLGENSRLENITRVYSHSQSLAQCRKWLDAHYPSIERIPVSSNAEAARRVQGEWNSAAIAGDMAEDLYSLTKIHENIEDYPDNSTRFLIIGRDDIPASGDDKTSIIASVHNAPGALYALLEPFQTCGVDLTRVETRPARSGKWRYVFFIDFVGHAENESVKDALALVRDRVADLRMLGSYPRAVL